MPTHDIYCLTITYLQNTVLKFHLSTLFLTRVGVFFIFKKTKQKELYFFLLKIMF